MVLNTAGVGTALPPVICRLWRGRATHQNAETYERIVREQVIPGIEARRIPPAARIRIRHPPWHAGRAT
jgi:hypothetical protein